MDPSQDPVAADDADEAKWVPVKQVSDMADLNPHIARIALEAAARFEAPSKKA